LTRAPATPCPPLARLPHNLSPPTTPPPLGGAFHGRPVDVWALGVTVYAFLRGGLPYFDKDLTQVYESIKQAPSSPYVPAAAGPKP
jgi:serine/threonine protein kinase